MIQIRLEDAEKKQHTEVAAKRLIFICFKAKMNIRGERTVYMCLSSLPAGVYYLK